MGHSWGHLIILNSRGAFAYHIRIVIMVVDGHNVRHLDVGNGCCNNKFATNSVTLLSMELETGFTKTFTDLLSQSARTHQLHKMKD